jgi:hypothetical protein
LFARKRFSLAVHKKQHNAVKKEAASSAAPARLQTGHTGENGDID